MLWYEMKSKRRSKTFGFVQLVNHPRTPKAMSGSLWSLPALTGRLFHIRFSYLYKFLPIITHIGSHTRKQQVEMLASW
jgi:hypothetical protein